MPSVPLAVAEFLNCEAHHLLRNLNASEIHVKMMSCPVWSIAHVFALKAFLQLPNCAALTGNCSILTRDKSFDLYISFSVNLIEPPCNPDAPAEPDEPPPPPPWIPNDVDHEAEDPGNDGSCGDFKGMLGWDICPLLDEGFGIFPFGSFVVGVARLKLSGSLHKLTLTMLDLKQWD